jgi:D-alanyl-D-alanine carboxypeptidase
MDATSFPTTSTIPEPATSGSIIELDDNLNVLSAEPFDSGPSIFWAAGAMISTLDDLETWGRALVEGTLLSPETQRARLTLVPMVGPETPPAGTVFGPIPGTPGPTLPARYGLGLFAMGGYIGHNGDIPGYEAVMMFEPQSGTLVVELQNTRLSQEEQGYAPPGMDLQLPSDSVSNIANILGQDPPLPPNPDGPTTPPCALPPPPPTTTAPPTTAPPGRPPPSPPADAVVGRPTFTA